MAQCHLEPSKWQASPHPHPKVKGYEPVEHYQWEMCVQFHSQGASENVPTTDTGEKIRNLIMKSHKEHGKDFLMFTKDNKLIQLKIFPKKVLEIKKFLNSVVHD
eukprot:8027434-Ditylum_brightwellii.AAC.1